MQNNSYTTSIEVAGLPEKVFTCINEVSKWWSKDFEGSSAKLDDEFIIHHPGRHFSKQRVIEFVPYKKIVWIVISSELDWLQKDKHEWTNTKMIFELISNKDKTVIHFMHEGLIPENESYARCSQGWDIVIKERLFELIVFDRII